MEESVRKIQSIFKLISKRQELKWWIEDHAKDSTKLTQLEETISKFCFESSKLYIKISHFLAENTHFRKSRFIYKREDFQERLRKDVEKMSE